jgi:hypothetical protein
VITQAQQNHRVERAWVDYYLRTLPADARANQVIESHRAFYAGARAALKILKGAAFLSEREPSEADLESIDLLERELTAFERDVKAGAA